MPQHDGYPSEGDERFLCAAKLSVFKPARSIAALGICLGWTRGPRQVEARELRRRQGETSSESGLPALRSPVRSPPLKINRSSNHDMRGVRSDWDMQTD